MTKNIITVDEMQAIEVNCLSELFDKMRSIIADTCKYYQTDGMIDVEAICEDYYTKAYNHEYVWSVGECGTHLTHVDNRYYVDNGYDSNYTYEDRLKAIYANYPKNTYYHIVIK